MFLGVGEAGVVTGRCLHISLDSEAQTRRGAHHQSLTRLSQTPDTAITHGNKHCRVISRHSIKQRERIQFTIEAAVTLYDDGGWPTSVTINLQVD